MLRTAFCYQIIRDADGLMIAQYERLESAQRKLARLGAGYAIRCGYDPTRMVHHV